MIAIGSKTHAALMLLARGGPMGATDFGSELWRDRKRRRIVSSNGGGDYAAQSFLGRLRMRGLVRTTGDYGSSRWEITPKGRDELARTQGSSG